MSPLGKNENVAGMAAEAFMPAFVPAPVAAAGMVRDPDGVAHVVKQMSNPEVAEKANGVAKAIFNNPIVQFVANRAISAAMQLGKRVAAEKLGDAAFGGLPVVEVIEGAVVVGQFLFNQYLNRRQANAA